MSRRHHYQWHARSTPERMLFLASASPEEAADTGEGNGDRKIREIAAVEAITCVTITRCCCWLLDGPPHPSLHAVHARRSAQPIARADRRGFERLERINQAVNNTPYSVLFFGDS
jgi:hypothetical protein